MGVEVHAAADPSAVPSGRPSVASRIDLVLVACLVLGAVLRGWGLGHDLPSVYNPDESSIVLRALSLGARALNPHNFVYPSLYFYVLALVVGCDFLVRRALGGVVSLKAYETAFLMDPSHVYLLARVVPVAAGVAAIAGVYALARRVGSRGAARAAAFLMAVAYVPVRDAHVVKHDVPAALIIVLVVLASWHVWKRGRPRDSVLAGALAGAAFALHYYAVFATVPVAVAHLLRVRSLGRLLGSRTAWLSAATFAVTFACLSPYVLIDYAVALRDVAAIRASVVGYGVTTFGWFGGGVEHLRILAGQGAGIAMLAAAVGGAAALARTAPASAAWFLSFPVVFFVFIANSWPSGRTANPLYPFIAVAAAVGIERLAGTLRSRAVAIVALTAICAAQPLVMSIAIDRLFARDDTRTIARKWIESHVPPGSGIAIPGGSVQLVPTRERLREAVLLTVGSEARASRRFQSILALDPYPSPAYRLLYLGRRAMDQDKMFLDPGDLRRDPNLRRLRQAGIRYVIVHQFSPAAEDDPLRRQLATEARLVFRVSPFNQGSGPHSEVQMPNFDVRPGFDVDRAGPIVEIWEMQWP